MVPGSVVAAADILVVAFAAAGIVSHLLAAFEERKVELGRVNDIVHDIAHAEPVHVFKSDERFGLKGEEF